MKTADHLNMMAVLADAEARSTALLIESIAATVLCKLNPPEDAEVAEIVVTQGDLAETMETFMWQASYDDSGTMTLRLSRKSDELEVTSD